MTILLYNIVSKLQASTYNTLGRSIANLTRGKNNIPTAVVYTVEAIDRPTVFYVLHFLLLGGCYVYCTTIKVLNHLYRCEDPDTSVGI